MVIIRMCVPIIHSSRNFGNIAFSYPLFSTRVNLRPSPERITGCLHGLLDGVILPIFKLQGISTLKSTHSRPIIIIIMLIFCVRYSEQIIM